MSVGENDRWKKVFSHRLTQIGKLCLLVGGRNTTKDTKDTKESKKTGEKKENAEPISSSCR